MSSHSREKRAKSTYVDAEAEPTFTFVKEVNAYGIRFSKVFFSHYIRQLQYVTYTYTQQTRQRDREGLNDDADLDDKVRRVARGRRNATIINQSRKYRLNLNETSLLSLHRTRLPISSFPRIDNATINGTIKMLYLFRCSIFPLHHTSRTKNCSLNLNTYVPLLKRARSNRKALLSLCSFTSLVVKRPILFFINLRLSLVIFSDTLFLH